MSYLHHSSSLAWKIPWMEEPGRLQSTGSLRVGHDWATSVHFSLSCIGEGNGNPLQCSCLENRRDGGAWWAAVYGVAQSRTQLKWLSSSRSKCPAQNHFICIHCRLTSWNTAGLGAGRGEAVGGRYWQGHVKICEKWTLIQRADNSIGTCW